MKKILQTILLIIYILITIVITYTFSIFFYEKMRIDSEMIIIILITTILSLLLLLIEQKLIKKFKLNEKIYIIIATLSLVIFNIIVFSICNKLVVKDIIYRCVPINPTCSLNGIRIYFIFIINTVQTFGYTIIKLHKMIKNKKYKIITWIGIAFYAIAYISGLIYFIAI